MRKLNAEFWGQRKVILDAVFMSISLFYGLYFFKHILENEFVAGGEKAFVVVPFLALVAVCFIFTGRLFRDIDLWNGRDIRKVPVYTQEDVMGFAADLENKLDYKADDDAVKKNRGLLYEALLHANGHPPVVHDDAGVAVDEEE